MKFNNLITRIASSAPLQSDLLILAVLLLLIGLGLCAAMVL